MEKEKKKKERKKKADLNYTHVYNVKTKSTTHIPFVKALVDVHPLCRQPLGESRQTKKVKNTRC